MRIKYNRVSTLQQTGERFTADTEKYDLVLLDKVSGKVSFIDRPEGKKLFDLAKSGEVKEIVVEELSRLGRNTGDVVRTLEKFEEFHVNIVIKNLGLQSRPLGEKNPIWPMITAVLSSMYQMELENIKERTSVGRQVYVQNGGTLGRPVGSNETEKDYLEKPMTKKIVSKILEGRSVIEISKLYECSSSTVTKARKLGKKHGRIV